MSDLDKLFPKSYSNCIDFSSVGALRGDTAHGSVLPEVHMLLSQFSKVPSGTDVLGARVRHVLCHGTSTGQHEACKPQRSKTPSTCGHPALLGGARAHPWQRSTSRRSHSSEAVQKKHSCSDNTDLTGGLFPVKPFMYSLMCCENDCKENNFNELKLIVSSKNVHFPTQVWFCATIQTTLETSKMIVYYFIVF